MRSGDPVAQPLGVVQGELEVKDEIWLARDDEAIRLMSCRSEDSLARECQPQTRTREKKKKRNNIKKKRAHPNTNQNKKSNGRAREMSFFRPSSDHDGLEIASQPASQLARLGGSTGLK